MNLCLWIERTISRRRLDFTSQRPNVLRALHLVKRMNLLDLQLRDFLAAAPNDGSAARVRLQHELDALLELVTEDFRQDHDDELHGMVFVVEEHNVVRRRQPRLALFALLGARNDRRIGVAHTSRSYLIEITVPNGRASENEDLDQLHQQDIRYKHEKRCQL